MEISGSLGKKRIRLKEKGISGSQILWHFVATGFGLGYLPLAPGTWASLATVLFLAGLYSLPFAHLRIVHLSLVILLLPVAWITAGLASRAMEESDPSIVVIDEILGQLLCLLMFPITVTNLVLGFVLFRLFDILKPPPVRQCESFKGGLGIVADDLVAGLYAAILLWLFNAR